MYFTGNSLEMFNDKTSEKMQMFLNLEKYNVNLITYDTYNNTCWITHEYRKRPLSSKDI